MKGRGEKRKEGRKKLVIPLFVWGHTKTQRVLREVEAGRCE